MKLTWCYLYIIDRQYAVGISRFVDSGSFEWAISDARQWSKQGKEWKIVRYSDHVVIAQSKMGRAA